jgi:hypothetical protein
MVEALVVVATAVVASGRPVGLAPTVSLCLAEDVARDFFVRVLQIRFLLIAELSFIFLPAGITCS